MVTPMGDGYKSHKQSSIISLSFERRMVGHGDDDKKATYGSQNHVNHGLQQQQ